MTRKQPAKLPKTIPVEWLEHSNRFRKVSNRYPRRVTEAYEGASAMADSDEEVAAKVAAWERRHGLPVRDWYKVGMKEGSLPVAGSPDRCKR